MNFFKKNKGLIITAVIAFSVGVIGSSSSGIDEETYNSVKVQLETAKTDLSTSESKIKELEYKVKEAQPFFSMSDAEKEAMQIETQKKEEENKKEQERIAKEKSKEDEAKRQAELDAKSTTLGNGTYLVGKDIPEGVYDLFAVKGGGNVISIGQVNTIMGVSGDEGFYQREQQNVALKSGTSVDLKSVTVKFVPDDGYEVKN